MDNIRYIPEWEEQEFVQLVFPHQNTDWVEYLDDAIDTFVDIAKAIQKYQKCLIIAKDLNKTKMLFKNKKNLIFVKIDSDDTWSRDFGGISVSCNKKPTILDFKFNGWGGKYSYKKDNNITKQLKLKGLLKGYSHKSYNFILEGGSIETNGEGVLLTTSNCLLNKNRNKLLNKNSIEKILKDSLGIKKILWLQNGELIGDDTDSHIDTLARFIDRNTIVYQSCDNKEDIHYESFEKMRKELDSFTNLNGEKFKLIPLPWITNRVYDDKILPATYANFLIINRAVLVPVYNDKNDQKALEIFKKLFPKRDIIPIDATTLIKQHGSLHCVTMNYMKLNYSTNE